MSRLVLYMSMSLDGFIAGSGDDKDNLLGVGGQRLHDWLRDGGADPQLLPAWYAFRDARARRRAVEWLAGNSLVDQGAATRFLDDHEPAVP